VPGLDLRRRNSRTATALPTISTAPAAISASAGSDRPEPWPLVSDPVVGRPAAEGRGSAATTAVGSAPGVDGAVAVAERPGLAVGLVLAGVVGADVAALGLVFAGR
jgi:hypothetical protein